MTDEQIKQKALEYSGCSQEWFDDISYVGESTAYDDAHAFYDGAHSRDEEIEELRKLLFEKECDIQFLEHKLRNPWISVEDRLPEKDGKTNTSVVVYVLYGKGISTSAWYDFETDEWHILCGIVNPETGDDTLEDLVTHWMPIPQLKEA